MPDRCCALVRVALCGLMVWIGSASPVHAQGRTASDRASQQTVSARGNAITDLVLKQGIFEEIVLIDYPSVDLSELVVESDLIAEGTILSQRSFVSDGAVWTDYDVQIAALLKSRQPAMDTKPVLTVRKRGGSLPFEGRTFVSVDNGFPSFQTGEQYVFFLRTRSDERVYEPLGGPSGAYRIVDGSVTSTFPIAEFRDAVARRANTMPSTVAQAAR